VLFLSATLISFWSGFLTGKVLAWRRGGWMEYSATISGVTLYTVFTPWFALMMIWLFAVQLDWLPAGKFLSPMKWLDAVVDANYVFTRMFYSGMIVFLVVIAGLIYSNNLRGQARPAFRAATLLVPMIGAVFYWQSSGVAHLAADIASHLVLPVLTLTLISYAGMMLLTRTSMLETLREDYIQTARAKGLPSKMVRDKHAARNALLPVWTSLVFSLANTVGGGIITETVFSWPGIGQSLLNSALQSDIPLAMATLTILGVLTLVGHLVVDIGYVYLDPRIRYREA
jgi:peptide/nickel transport system permease protein